MKHFFFIESAVIKSDRRHLKRNLKTSIEASNVKIGHLVPP